MDPRIARTRRSLQEALLDLAREQPLDDITVADVAERAGVNRSSFYQHYADKETLLADALDAVAEAAGAHLPSLPPWGEEPPAVLLSYLEHLDANAALYRRVLGENGSAVAVVRLRTRLQTLVLEEMARAESDDPYGELPAELVAAGIAGSVLGMLGFWLAMDPRPDPATASNWVWRVLRAPSVPPE
ncbi:MAG TPA: TetR/AcrR family transcriptional regulator [Pseudolysinimonas sp.]|nr:TetR/AcrR family transcriptional regulator [Pseudolysinimonas sp.]